MPIPKTAAFIIAIATVGIILTVTTTALLNPSRQTVPANGSVGTTQTPLETVNISLYNDPALTQSITSVDWASITPGSTTTKTIYIKNTGTEDVTLTMGTSEWTPREAEGPISLSWNKDGATLTASQSTSAILTLHVEPSISNITTFSFSITVTGTPT